MKALVYELAHEFIPARKAVTVKVSVKVILQSVIKKNQKEKWKMLTLDIQLQKFV